MCLVTNGTLLPRQLPTLEGSPALHKLSVSLHSFEGNGRQDAAAPYLEGVWQAAQRLSSRGVLCALRLWNGGGLDRRNEEILSFLSEKLGRDVTALPTGPSGATGGWGRGCFWSRAERFDWPDPAAPDSGTEFCHGLRSQIAVLCDGTVVPCCLDSEERHGAGKPAPAGAGGDTGLPTGHSHGDGLFPAAAVGGAVPPLRLRCTVQPIEGHRTDDRSDMEEQILKQLAQPLLAWYDIHRRILPWREEVSPYRTWVSEIMLQQTRVAAVLPYFQRFMEALPHGGGPGPGRRRSGS